MVINSVKMNFKNYRYTPLILIQIILAILYFLYTKYDEEGHVTRGSVFEDTHVMIFIGFGFLMTFLKRYCYSALGFNWFLAALVIQWALLCQNFFHMKDGKIILSKELILEADIMSATVLITFGALLGITSGLQLLFIALVETTIGCINIYLITDVYQASDIGGSIAIHTYGAYFGLGASLGLVLGGTKTEGTSDLNGPTYTSDVTAMIGSIFLWIYWPSFNSALAETTVEYNRATINSYLSLASATVTTFILSALLSHHKDGKLDMVHVQNSTLAGGVGVGAVCNMHITAGGAICVGIGAGALSVLGYRYLTPLITKMGVNDTCGVNNLHGMPGVYSGILSVIVASLATSDVYKTELVNIFPAMGEGRTAGEQALYQFIALISTLGIAFISGLITGFIARLPIFEPLSEEEKFDDAPNWELPG